MQARGFVRDAAEVGRVWGSFRRSTLFTAKGVSFFDLTLKRPLVVHIDEPRPRLASSTSPFNRRFGPTRRGRGSGVNVAGVSHCSMT